MWLKELQNPNTICYMNSVVQCLVVTEKFTKYFLKRSFEDENTYKITKYINLLIKNIVCSNEKTINISNLKQILASSGITQFNNNECQCSNEFFLCLIDRIHEETKKSRIVEFHPKDEKMIQYLCIKKKISEIKNNVDVESLTLIKKLNIELKSHIFEEIEWTAFQFMKEYYKKNYSVITKLFTGIIIQTTKCTECNTINMSFEIFNSLPISLPSTDKMTLDYCIKNDHQYELIKDEYTCDECKKKVVAIRKTYYWKLPEYLVITIKRYGNTLKKNMCELDFPHENLNLKELKIQNQYTTNENYTLYGVIEHHGHLNTGHYVAYVKNPLLNKWFLCNDAKINSIQDEEIKDHIDKRNAYMLFYKK